MTVRLRALVIAVVLAAAPTARAGLEGDAFHPTDPGHGYFGVDGAFTTGHLGFTGGLFGTYAHRPLVLRAANGAVASDLIANQIGLDFVGSFGLFGRVELGVDIPVVPFQSGGDSLGLVPGGITKSGIGDVRLDLKGNLYTLHLRNQNRIGFTLVVGFSVPSGEQASFLGG